MVKLREREVAQCGIKGGSLTDSNIRTKGAAAEMHHSAADQLYRDEER